MTAFDALEEERAFLLRSLRDLEAEHTAGDIDDADYEALRDDYTVRAAVVLRALDGPASPDAAVGESAEDSGGGPGEASAEASGGSAGGGSAGGTDSDSAGGPAEAAAEASAGLARRRRISTRTLVIVLIVAVAIGGTLLAVQAATAPRSTGETVTGQQVGQGAINQLLVQAIDAASKGDGLTAMKDYQKILATDPTQVEALTGEGWILVQTRQASVVVQGLSLLANAEQVDPSYGPAHLYRASGLLSQGDAKDAIPELQYYLAHDPDPNERADAQQALAQAQAAAAQAPSTTTP